MFATVKVSLSDFDLDDVIEYVEDEGYIVEKACVEHFVERK